MKMTIEFNDDIVQADGRQIRRGIGKATIDPPAITGKEFHPVDALIPPIEFGFKRLNVRKSWSPDRTEYTFSFQDVKLE